MKSLYKNILAAAAFAVVEAAALAAPVTVFEGGADGYGAVITDTGGANVTSNGVNANIGLTGNGNVIKWDHLNVGAGNSLNFNFTQAGQIGLNKVTGGSMSKFAGTISTSGADGHLIISNPSGMVFMNGATVNADAGSMTFTTHDADWNGKLNGDVATSETGSGAGIIVGHGSGTVPVFRVNESLNLIGANIDIKNADIFAGGGVRLMSSDGVNFILGHVLSGTGNRTKIADASISIKNTQINAVKKQDGTIEFVDGEWGMLIGNEIKIADSNINMNNGSVIAHGKGEISVQNSTINDANLSADKNIKIVSSDLQNSDVFTPNDFQINNSNIKNSDLYAGNNAELSDSSVDNVSIQGDGSMKISSSDIKNSKILTEGAFKINNSDIEKSSLYSMNEDFFNSFELAGKRNSINNSSLKDVDIMTFESMDINSSKLKNTTIDVFFGELIVDNSDIEGKLSVTAGTGADMLKEADLDEFSKSDAFTQHDIEIYDSELTEDRDLYASGEIIIGNRHGIEELNTQKNVSERTYSETADEIHHERTGKDVDTIFRRRFTPKSFAAGDDEVKAMKRHTMKGVSVSENGNIKLERGFTIH